MEPGNRHSIVTAQSPLRPGRTGDEERGGAAGELAVEDQEREPAEVVPVQVGHEHRADLARVEPQARRKAVSDVAPQSSRTGAGQRVMPEVDAGLEPASPLPNASPDPANVTVII